MTNTMAMGPAMVERMVGYRGVLPVMWLPLSPTARPTRPTHPPAGRAGSGAACIWLLQSVGGRV